MTEEKLTHHQVPWLELARQQSQALADWRAAHWRSFSRASMQSPPLLHLSLTERYPALKLSGYFIALIIIIVGSATAVAYLHHLKSTAKPPAIPLRPSTSAPKEQNSVKKYHQRLKTISRPARLVPQAPEAKKRIPRRAPALSAPIPATPPGAEHSQLPGEQTDRTLNFDLDELSGGGEIIMVNPHRKAEPLWTPEEYGRQGPYPDIKK